MFAVNPLSALKTREQNVVFWPFAVYGLRKHGMKPEHEKCGTSTFDIIVQGVYCPAQKEARWKTAFTD